MIRCNLSVLLAQRSLTVTQVSKETGISRTTLNALEKNYSQGLQLSTINTLCSYLQTTPSELLKYYPVDIIWKCGFSFNSWSSGKIIISKNNKSTTFPIGFLTDIFTEFAGDESPRICGNASLYVDLSQEKEEDTKYINSIFANLPIEFKSDIEGFLLAEFHEFLLQEKSIFVSDDIDLNIEFGFEEL